MEVKLTYSEIQDFSVEVIYKVSSLVSSDDCVATVKIPSISGARNVRGASASRHTQVSDLQVRSHRVPSGVQLCTPRFSVVFSVSVACSFFIIYV